LSPDPQATLFINRLVTRIACVPLATGARTIMFNQHTGFKIAVIVPLGGFPFFEVPPSQLDQVRQLLIENGIGHTVGSRLIRDGPAVAVAIHISKLWGRERIQHVLDSVG
jgi:hypothetical protein